MKYHLLDDLSESYAGIYGRLTPYEVHDLIDWTSTEDTIKYYRACYDWLQEERKTAPQDSYIQNQLDAHLWKLGWGTLQLLGIFFPLQPFCNHDAAQSVPWSCPGRRHF